MKSKRSEYTIYTRIIYFWYNVRINILAVYYTTFMIYNMILYSAGLYYNVLIFGQTTSLCTVIIVCNLLTLICPWYIKTVLKCTFLPYILY